MVHARVRLMLRARCDGADICCNADYEMSACMTEHGMRAAAVCMQTG